MRNEIRTNNSSSLILHPSSLRILLWDIDGTLMRSARRDAFKDYTVPMLLSAFATAGRLSVMSVSGLTDLQTVIEPLRADGFSRDKVRDRIDELKKRYMHETERATSE